jgi:tetratricopeptide (TPR) repeat protein
MYEFAGRASLEAGDFPTAIKYLRTASEDPDYSLRALQHRARAAMLGEDYGEAILAFKQLKDSKLSTKEQASEAQERIDKLAGRLIKVVRVLIENGHPRKAWRMLDSGKFIRQFEDRLAVERKRVVNSIVSKVQELDSDEAEERYRLGKLINELNPKHEFGLKSAAIGAMRMHKFEESLKYWTALKPLTKNKNQIEKHIERCKLLLSRESG